jgi:hypothetical protein
MSEHYSLFIHGTTGAAENQGRGREQSSSPSGTKPSQASTGSSSPPSSIYTLGHKRSYSERGQDPDEDKDRNNGRILSLSQFPGRKGRPWVTSHVHITSEIQRHTAGNSSCTGPGFRSVSRVKYACCLLS